MGAPHPQPLLDALNLKGIVLENKGTLPPTTTTTNPSSNGSLWEKELEAHDQRANLTSQTRKKVIMRPLDKNNRRVLMKRRRVIRRARRSENGIEKRVRTLKRLIPSRESSGLEGLFRDTAAYIVSLQMRVRVMQIMVDLLAGSQDHH